VLEAFGSFGFCKAHAASFALPTFQSAWLKTHHTAYFLAGVLTHDPGMYPKRLILDDARHFGVAVLGLDVDRSGGTYTVERLDDPDRPDHPDGPGAPGGSEMSDGPRYGIRVALSEVKGISEAEVLRIEAAAPYRSLTDFWHRAQPSRPVAERLVMAGGFDRVYGLEGASTVSRRGKVTRRDLLLQLNDLDRFTRAITRATGSRVRRGQNPTGGPTGGPTSGPTGDAVGAGGEQRDGVWARTTAQSRAARPAAPVDSVQLTLDLGDAPADALYTGEVSGLPELSPSERVKAELEILGLDASRHVMELYEPFLAQLGVTRSTSLLQQRSAAELVVAGVKVATQTPPIRSGRRVVFLTLDDATGPVDATFFEDALGSCATTVFHSWLLVVRGELRRTGKRGVSLRATGCWDLSVLHDRWRAGGIAAVAEQMQPPGDAGAQDGQDGEVRRVLVHPTGYRLSPYADVRPAGVSGERPDSDRLVPERKLWHSSPGSSGR
jgi:error-prone DNA polymerase